MKRWGWMLTVLALLLTALPVRAEGPEVQAKSALLMDAATGTILYQQNAHEKLAPASVTKVMTLLLVMEAIDSGRIGWQDPVTASEAAAAKGGSQIYLKVGEQMSVEDMVKAVAVSSANDCACALAELVAGSETAFVQMMNEKAAALQMADTHFVNCTGLDDAPEAENHRTSAHDIAVMSRELLVKHPSIKQYTTIWMDTVRNGSFGLSNTNKLIRFYPGATGLKTGFTSGAGYCLSATARRDGMELIAVVMGCESSKIRLQACRQLLDYGFARYAVVTPELPGDARVPVKLGRAETVRAIPGETVQKLIEKGQKEQVRVRLELSPEVTAPVSRGQKLGTVQILVGEQVLAEVPMLAEQTVARLQFGELFLRALRAAAMCR